MSKSKPEASLITWHTISIIKAMGLDLTLSKDSLLNAIVEDFTKMPTKIKRIGDYDVVAETLRVVERKAVGKLI